MDNQDPIALGRLAVKVGLLTEEQLAAAKEEAGDKAGDLMTMLRTLERKGWLTPWQSGKLLKGDEDGYFLGGYRLLYKVASGSFGRVFRADDPRGGRIVAIKVLRAAGARTSSASTCSSARAASARRSSTPTSSKSWR